MAIKPFDPTKIIVTIGGVNVGDLSADDGVSVEYSGDVMTFANGLNGALAPTVNPDRSATITISVLQESSVNEQIRSLTGFGTPNLNTDPVAITVTDSGSNKRLVVAGRCWLMQGPSISFNNQAGSRAWVFKAESIVVGM